MIIMVISTSTPDTGPQFVRSIFGDGLLRPTMGAPFRVEKLESFPEDGFAVAHGVVRGG
jgi:hypothetical protein